MSTPGIELRWGYGFDQKPRKCEAFRPFVRESLELAYEGIYAMGLSIDERKYLWIEHADPNDKWLGGATEGKTCHVAIPNQEVKRRRVDTVWLAAIMVHELVHLIHNEYVEGDGMLEVAASEGIAHIAQYNFANELLSRRGRKGPPHRMVEKIRALPVSEKRRLEAEFWKASAKPYSDERFNEWFGRHAPPVGFPKGATVGVVAVSKQLRAGWEIPELITIPPEDVLDAA